MGLFQHFPYTNFHDLNLDIILKRVKDAEASAAASAAIAQGLEDQIQAAQARADQAYSAAGIAQARADEAYDTADAATSDIQAAQARADDAYDLAGDAISSLNETIARLRTLDILIDGLLPSGSLEFYSNTQGQSGQITSMAVLKEYVLGASSESAVIGSDPVTTVVRWVHTTPGGNPQAGFGLIWIAEDYAIFTMGYESGIGIIYTEDLATIDHYDTITLSPQ